MFMKTAISIPDDIHYAADEAARRLGFNRSQLYTRAIESFLQQFDADPVTVALDEICEDDGAPANFGRQLIDEGAWAW